jgi:hypothetical protein
LCRALITLLRRALITALVTLGRALAGRLLTISLLFGLHAAAILLALGFHALVFAAFRLHVLAALLVFGALALFSAHRLLLGLHVGLLLCRTTLLGCRTARRRFTAHPSSLRIGETSSSDQSRRGDGDQNAFSHGTSPPQFALPLDD